MSNKVNVGDKVFVVDKGSSFYREVGVVTEIDTQAHSFYPVTVEFSDNDCEWCIFEHKDLVVIPQ